MATRKSVSAKPTDKPELEPLSISRLGTFAKCQTAGYLRYRLKEKPDFVAHHLFVGTMIHEAIENYYNGAYESVGKAIRAILPKTLKEKGLTALQIQRIRQVAKVEADILSRFSSGEITKPGGERYANPHMTSAYKNLAKELGLYAMRAELADIEFGGIQLPSGGLPEVVARILELCDRYDTTLRIDRDELEWVRQEEGFDFEDVTPAGNPVRFLGYMDLVAKVKPEFTHKFNGKNHILIDYKTGAAHSPEEHLQSSSESMQLSLYNHVVTKLPEWGIAADDLFIALHYVDAAFVAPAVREDLDYTRLKSLVDAFEVVKNDPGMVKRLFYDSRDCQGCELRGACIKHFGMPTMQSGGCVVK